MSKICILNCSNPDPKNIGLESDEYVDLRERSSCFKDGLVAKQCRSWHSWAYALETEFFVYNKKFWPKALSYDNVVILVNRDIHLVLPIVKKLKSQGKKVAISYHEGVQDLLSTPGKKWVDLFELVKISDFYINIFGQYEDMFVGLFPGKSKFVNHTAPFDKLDRRVPFSKKTKNILVSTRTFNQALSRNTLATLSAMNRGYEFLGDVDFVVEDAGDIRELLSRLGMEKINVIQGPFEYNKWLDFISDYKWAVNHDLSMNLGQVSLDCMMVGTIPIGGTTWFNIEMGSSDKGDLRNLINILEWRDVDYHLEEMETLKRKIHPDVIKEELEKIFK